MDAEDKNVGVLIVAFEQSIPAAFTNILKFLTIAAPPESTVSLNINGCLFAPELSLKSLIEYVTMLQFGPPAKAKVFLLVRVQS